MNNYSERLLDIVAQNHDIECRRAFFGLITRYIYTPTQSRLSAFNRCFSHILRDDLLQLMRADDATIVRRADKSIRFEQNANGNLLLEGYRSADGQFVAIRLLQYAELDYRPITDVRYLTGHTAQAVIKML